MFIARRAVRILLQPPARSWRHITQQDVLLEALLKGIPREETKHPFGHRGIRVEQGGARPSALFVRGKYTYSVQ